MPVEDFALRQEQQTPRQSRQVFRSEHVGLLLIEFIRRCAALGLDQTEHKHRECNQWACREPTVQYHGPCEHHKECFYHLDAQKDQKVLLQVLICWVVVGSFYKPLAKSIELPLLLRILNDQ